MRSLDDFARDKLAQRERASRRRRLTPLSGHGAHIEHQGRRWANFAANDYLGLRSDARLIRAAEAALRDEGCGAGASRLITGNHPGYPELEADLAALEGTDAARVFGSGYLTNLGLIPALVGDADLILIDRLAHACMWSGARLSGATVRTVPHNDVDAFETALRDSRHRFRHCLMLTEGVFSMDGDASPLSALADLASARDAWLMVDDAHGTGVTGNGAGSVQAAGLSPEAVPLRVGTLSKGLGAYGGFVGCSQVVAELIVNRARTLVYSTALPASIVAAARAAVDIVRTEADRVRRPSALAARFADALGCPQPAAAIVPIVVHDEQVALRAAAAFAEHGFWVPAIRPPTVPDGTSRLRFSFSAAHTDDDVEGLIDIAHRVLHQ